MGNVELLKLLFCAIFLHVNWVVGTGEISSSLHLIKNGRWQVKNGLVSNGPLTAPVDIKKFLPDNYDNIQVGKIILTFPNPDQCDQKGKQWIEELAAGMPRSDDITKFLPLFVYRSVQSENLIDPNYEDLVESIPSCVTPSLSGVSFSERPEKPSLFYCAYGLDSAILVNGVVGNIVELRMNGEQEETMCNDTLISETINEVELVTSAGNQYNWALSIIVDFVGVADRVSLQKRYGYDQKDKLNNETDMGTMVVTARVLLPLKKPADQINQVPKYETLTTVMSFTFGISSGLLRTTDLDSLNIGNFLNEMKKGGAAKTCSGKKIQNGNRNGKQCSVNGGTKSMKMERNELWLMITIAVFLQPLLIKVF